MKWAVVWIVAERLWLWWAFPLCAEDAYITFHAAIDPAWTHASTSPAWMYVLRGLNALGLDPEIASRSILLVADALAVYGASRYLKPVSFWVFVGLWSLPALAGSFLSGMETHLIACGVVMAPAFRWAALVSALRPEGVIVGAIRPRIALMGLGLCLALNLLAHGSVLPQTVSSKAAVYGVNLFSGWEWFRPQGFGWLAIPMLASAFFSIPAAIGALTLSGYWVLGVPAAFWWYAIPPLAMLSVESAKLINRNRLIPVVVGLIAFAEPHQWERLTSRLAGEKALWDTGKAIVQRYQGGTILLEAAGMIPYLNPRMRVVDEIGLLDPWMAERRKRGPGWMTDAVAKYQPDLVLMRVKNLKEGGAFSGTGVPYRCEQERTDLMARYQLVGIGSEWGLSNYRVQMQSHVIAILSLKVANSP